MHQNKVSVYVMACWLITAMVAPIAVTAGTVSLLAAILLGAVSALLCWCVCQMPQLMLQKKWYCVLQFVWLCVLTGILSSMSVLTWPTGSDDPAVPLVLLLLAAFASMKGAKNASKVSAILFWFVCGLIAVLLVAGLEKVKPEYLELAWERPDGTAVLMLLLPAAVSFIPRQQGKVLHLSFAAVGILYIILSIWTVGSLSAEIVRQEQWPMYEAVKTISLFGIAERFEAVVSAAVTMSWFSLYSLLLSAAGSLSARISPEWGSKGTIAAAVIAAVWVLLRPSIPAMLPVFFTLSLWCIGPVPGLFNKLQKSAKKPKNNP